MRRATGFGATAGLCLLIAWPFYVTFQDALYWPFVALLAVTACLGLSILWITVNDMVKHPRRSSSLRPIRTFDAILGLLLSVPTLYELHRMFV